MQEVEYISIDVKGQPFSIDFHPTGKLIGVGLLSGQVKLFGISRDEPIKLASARPHTASCRALRFSAGGAGVFSAGSDMSLQLRDISTNKPVWQKHGAHDEAINVITTVADIGIASGDDSGVVKLWDLRKQSLALHFHENSDFIADLLYTAHSGNTLVAGSGDGCLSVFDLRVGRLLARSDHLDDELLSLALVKVN